MHIRKLPYAREKFEEYTDRRHQVIKRLTPFLSLMINEQNIYGYKVVRKLPNLSDYIPLTLLEVYGHTEFRTLNIQSILESHDTTRVFTARINEIDISKELISNERDITVDYLLENARTRRKIELPSIQEIAEATSKPLRISDRFTSNNVPESFRDVNNRIYQFEVNIGSLAVKNVIENNR